MRTIALEIGKISSVPMTTTEERQFEYDVFLSYNRLERHAGSFLPQHLHDVLNQKGIKSYKYGEDLEEGEEMAPAIDEAIRGSRIAVIILSTHYASSESCLSELVKILEQNKLNGRRAMPLFYGVEPTWVRRQTGSYHEAMAEHERRYGSGSDKVKLWRKALEEVGDIRGWTLATNQGEAEFVQGVVLEIGTALWHLKAPTAPKPNLRRAKVIGILIVYAVFFCSPTIIIETSGRNLLSRSARIGIISCNVGLCLIFAAFRYNRMTRENTT